MITRHDLHKWYGSTYKYKGQKLIIKLMCLLIFFFITCVALGDWDGTQPRLILMLFPVKPIILEKPEESTLSHASQVSSSPVKSACNPYKKTKGQRGRFKFEKLNLGEKLYHSFRICHTGVEPCKATRAAYNPDIWNVLLCQTLREII